MTFQTFINQIQANGFEFSTMDSDNSMFFQNKKKTELELRIDFKPMLNDKKEPYIKRYVSVWKTGQGDVPSRIIMVPFEKIYFDENWNIMIPKEVGVSIFDI